MSLFYLIHCFTVSLALLRNERDIDIHGDVLKITFQNMCATKDCYVPENVAANKEAGQAHSTNIVME